MKLQEFKNHLDNKGYEYTFNEGNLIVVYQGPVDLESLTTLPEGVKFENQGLVDLESLTTLPEGVKFENQGSVYLTSLTTLPEGVKFENQGSVYLESLTTLPEGVKFENQGLVVLESLTTLPEGVKFENQGPVDLESLTTLPEGVKFENQGHVYLESLTGKHKYLGKKYNFRFVDGSTMIITSTKSKDGFKINKAKYFEGGPVKKMTGCFIVEKGGFTAHGENIKQAIEDVNFKHMQANLDISELVESIKKSKVVTKNDYRLLTGACSSGCDYFMDQHGIKDLSVPLEKCKELVLGAFGGERFNELFS